MIKKIIMLLLASLFIFQAGCSSKNNNEVLNKGIQGDPLTVISTAIKNLNYSTNLEARKTIVTKINGKQTSAKVSELTTNSSSIYAVSSTELRSGNEKILFKRVRIKNILYEYNPGKSRWDTIVRSKEPALFTYNAYKSNRALILNLINEIYSEKENKFGDFLKRIKKEGIKSINGYDATIYSYNYDTEDSKRTIKQTGKIFVAEVNGKIYIVKVSDDKLVTFKSNKTTTENATDIEIKNIGQAKKLTQKK